MTTVRITDDALEVTLTRLEKVAGLLRDLRVPLSAVREVEIVEDPVAATRGLRAPGLGLPGIRKIGTWRGADGRGYVSVRRGEPGLRIALSGQRYDTVLVSTPDAAVLAERLTSALRGARPGA